MNAQDTKGPREGHHRSTGSDLGRPLSLRQEQIILLRGEGFKLSQIAALMGVARSTIHNAQKIAFRKLGARNCSSAIYIYMLARFKR